MPAVRLERSEEPEVAASGLGVLLTTSMNDRRLVAEEVQVFVGPRVAPGRQELSVRVSGVGYLPVLGPKLDRREASSDVDDVVVNVRNVSPVEGGLQPLSRI